MKLLADKSRLLCKMKLPVLFHPGRKNEARHKFHIYKLHANENLEERDAWSAFVTTGIPVSQHLLQDTLREYEVSGIQDALMRMNPHFLSATSVVKFFCTTCEVRCFANEQALIFAGAYKDFKFAAVLKA